MVQESMLCPDTVMLRGTKEIDWLKIAAIPVLWFVGVIKITEFQTIWASLKQMTNNNPQEVAATMFPAWKVRMAYASLADRSRELVSEDQHINLLRIEENLFFYRRLECSDPRDITKPERG